MNTSLTSLHKAKGSVLVLTALALFLLMGMAALAIDLSNAETNKTRLQNLADALALSAAISLNKQEYSPTDPKKDVEVYAEKYAKLTNTLPEFKSASGNGGVTLTAADFTFTFATNWSDTAADWKDATAIDGARFARVTMNPQNLNTWFARLMGFDTLAVSASAVAGTTPINPCQNVLPIMMCVQTTPSVDKNCEDNTQKDYNSNNDCYGYELNVVYETKTSKWQSGDIGPGNFGFFDVGAGGSDIRKCLAGDPDCTANLCKILASPGPASLNSEPGGKVGPGDQGLNTRFDDFSGPIKYAPPPSTILPDSLVSDSLGVTLSNTGRTPGDEFNPANNYTVPPQAKPSAQIYNYFYKDNYLTSSDLTSGHAFTPGRRLVTMPLVRCGVDPTKGGGGVITAPIEGMGCWFLTEKQTNKAIYAEFLGEGTCPTNGTVTSTNNFGFYKVQLYKDPFGGIS